jgi:c-di-GMP-binding flagellar brake protein YcgR
MSMAAEIEFDASLELASSVDNSRFLVRHRQEIARILRGLSQRREIVSAFFNGGSELMLTAVLDADHELGFVMLDCGANPAANERILQAEKIIFVTALDRVKVQFSSVSIEMGVFQAGSALMIPFPEQVLQLQRREYYRLTTPIMNPLMCEVVVKPGVVESFPIVDISAGGIGMIIGNTPDQRLAVGQTYPGCRIELPGVGPIEITLSIQNLFEATLKSGKKIYRSGCKFTNLRGAAENQIHRYILRLERERINNASR